jgi:hypothetical protein
MVLDEKTKVEYMLLRNYQENGILLRGFLLKMPFLTLEQIEEDKWPFKFNENEKPKVKSFIQIDIISKIMMYIEDLAILSESFISQRNFYDIINDASIDIGEMIRCFFNKISDISDEGIYQIMSYAASNQLGLGNRSTIVVNKHLNSNVKELKRILNEIGNFGITNHPLFKKFKHAGTHIFCGTLNTSGFLEGFDFSNLVPVGPNAIMDIIPIPYSKQVLDGYHIIIHGLQKVLGDMVENRIVCIQRNLNGLIPKQRYDLTALSSEEADLMTQIIDNFYALNPPKEIIISDSSNPTVKREKIRWYLNLPNFLAECKERKEIEEKYKHTQNHI